MLLDLQLNDHLRLRKQHPCGSYEWTVTRLGADIGLQCNGCGRRTMLTRRELVRRSFPVETYQPADSAAWADAYARFIDIVET